MLALSHGTMQILSAIGVWPEVTARDATPIKSIHISDLGHSGFTRLRHTDAGVDALGYIVPARVLGQALMARMDNVEAEFICPGQVNGISYDEDCVSLTAQTNSGETTVRCGLVVLADGGRSPAREWLGIKTGSRDYGQTAILTTVTPERDHHNKAYERFTATGPLALLPTSGNRYAVVWTTTSSQAPELMGLSDSEFLASLQARFGYRAGNLRNLGERKAYPLSLVRVPKPIARRAVVIGNAAHTIHPVSGQGFNLGLRDVAVLAEVLHNAVRNGDDIGSITVLGPYADWRRDDTRATITFTDGLIRLFCNESPPLALLRGVGMVAVDIFPSLKRFLLRRTMGLAGRVPQLGRGVPLE
jgi:2-octaprenyl-6-methoxyphenol hydroxylase